MKILIVDSHEVIREGLSFIMKQSYLIDECFYASSGEEAINLVGLEEIDLVILDICLPDCFDGLDVLKKIKKESTNTKVIIFSMSASMAYQKRACEFGADGYLSKSIKRDMLIEKIDQIILGEKIFDQPIFQDQCTEHEVEMFHWELPLSEKEREIFFLFVMGYPHKYISEKLKISINTIENYRQKLNKKLGKSKRHEWLEIAKKYQVI